MPPNRDDFPDGTKRILAARVNHRCSNPGCLAQTSGPQDDPAKAVNLGVAAHIAAAAPGGPRFDPSMAPDQRADIANGIWLCQNCAKLVDNDPVHFSSVLLRDWKLLAEEQASKLAGKTVTSGAAPAGIVDKWVSLSYLEKSGIDRQLRNQGYDLVWSSADKESERIDLENWEPVLVKQPDGTLARFKVRDHPVVGGYLVLLKKRKA